MSKPIIISGPLTSKTSRKEAEEALVNHPAFVKGSSYDIDEVEGRWVAAIVTAEFPPADEDSPSEEAPEAPEPKEEPSDSESDSEPSDDSDSSDKPEHKEKGKGGVEAQIEHLTQLVTTLVEALGLGEMDPGMPGEEMGPPPPEHGGPSDKQHLIHERALKPGEAPPGTTPVGSPAFASVDHPWAEMIHTAAKFEVDDEIGDESVASVTSTLQSMASEIGYKVAAITPYTNADGKRCARAMISRF